MLLIDKINELNTTATQLQTALNAAQALQDERIAQKVSAMKGELKKEVSNELQTSITNTLEIQFKGIVETNTSKEVLNQIFVDNVENNPSVINRVLVLSDFENKLNDKIDERVKIYANAFARYTNSFATLAVCLQNELAAISEAMKNVAVIELYEERLTAGKPIYKSYHEI